MADILTVDRDALYKAWYNHMKSNVPEIKKYGMITDGAVAKFPYANMQVTGESTAESDLENNECTMNLTIQTDCYVNDQSALTLQKMDDNCRSFFIGLGFRKMGDSVWSTTNGITRSTSRFNMPNFNGVFDNLTTS